MENKYDFMAVLRFVRVSVRSVVGRELPFRAPARSVVKVSWGVLVGLPCKRSLMPS